jgi:hypothetical protein
LGKTTNPLWIMIIIYRKDAQEVSQIDNKNSSLTTLAVDEETQDGCTEDDESRIDRGEGE